MDYSPKLAADGSNWGIYRARMVWRLRVRSLADHLTNAEVPESGTEADTVDSDEAEDAIRWERDDETVKRYIAASIPDDVFKQIKGLGGLSAKAIWQNLTTQFERKSWRIRVQLWTRLSYTIRNVGVTMTYESTSLGWPPCATSWLTRGCPSPRKTMPTTSSSPSLRSTTRMSRSSRLQLLSSRRNLTPGLSPVKLPISMREMSQEV